MSLGRDRIQALEVFATVVEEGSFSAAGRRLDMVPSSISRIIDRIETRLGVRLLLRSTRALTLTAEGEDYATMARRVLRQISEGEEAISDKGAASGRLRISAAVSHGRMRVVPLLREFMQRHPHILIDLTLRDSIVDVAAGEADVAVRFGHLPDSPLIARKIGEERSIVVACPSYLQQRGMPHHPEDLRDHDCLLFNFDRRVAWWPFRIDGSDRMMEVRGMAVANSGETLASLALAGLGITRISAFSVTDAIRRGELVEILAPFNTDDRTPVHAVFNGGANLPARIRLFVDFLSEHHRTMLSS